MHSAHRSKRQTVALALAAFAAAAAACSKPDTPPADTAAAAAPAATSTGTDTGMTGMDHSKMAGMSHGPAKDADQEFLRMMSDHHEGLIKMMDAAMEKASSATAKADAKKLHDKQHKEQDDMVAMLKSSYSESYEPNMMPNNKAMNDSLQAMASGPAYDRTMYHHIVMHHQEGIKMIDDFRSRLTKPDLKQMAQKMKADQQAEIQEFERKMNSAAPKK